MNSHPVLVALVGGPMNGRVIEADVSEKEIEMNDLNASAARVLVYRVTRFQAEIEEAEYVGPRYLYG